MEETASAGPGAGPSNATAAAGPRLALERFLPYRLNVAATRVSRGLARLYAARFGLDIPQWRVVATLGQFGEATAVAIGRHSAMHKTKVSRAVAALETRGLVVRAASTRDRREMPLALSEDGRRIYDAIVPLALRYAEELVRPLAPEDRAALERILHQLEAVPDGDDGDSPEA